MLIEPAIYLNALMRDYLLNAGRIVVQEFASARDLMALREDLIFNCTGLGSRDLFGDLDLHPLRGQLAILLPQPEVRYALGGGPGYMFPRADGILLGGTFERDVWDTTPDPAAIAEIIASHKRFFDSFRCVA